MPPLTDKELVAEMKLCKKNKKRNFLFAVGSKIEDHYLLLSKKKIPRSKGKDAKKEAGAPKAYAGVVELNKETGEIEFHTDLSFADKQAKALRMLIKKRLGLKSFECVLKLVEKIPEADFDDDAVDDAGENQAAAPAGENAPPEPPPIPADKLKQAATAWDKTRNIIKKDVEKVQKEIIKTFKDAPNSKDLAKGVKELDSILNKLDDSLTKEINGMLNAPAEAAQKTLSNVEKLVGDHLKYIKNDPMLKNIDKNPFSSVAIQKTAEQSLNAIEKLLKN